MSLTIGCKTCIYCGEPVKEHHRCEVCRTCNQPNCRKTFDGKCGNSHKLRIRFRRKIDNDGVVKGRGYMFPVNKHPVSEEQTMLAAAIYYNSLDVSQRGLELADLLENAPELYHKVRPYLKDVRVLDHYKKATPKDLKKVAAHMFLKLLELKPSERKAALRNLERGDPAIYSLIVHRCLPTKENNGWCRLQLKLRKVSDAQERPNSDSGDDNREVVGESAICASGC